MVIICGAIIPALYPFDLAPSTLPHSERSRYLIDDGIPFYDCIPRWYEGDTDVVAKNKMLKERMLKSQEKRR